MKKKLRLYPPQSQSFKTLNTHEYEIKNYDLKVKGCKVEGATKNTHTHTHTHTNNTLQFAATYKCKAKIRVKSQI